jgi:hypothetical protein
LRAQPFISERGLHPFFDNLVAQEYRPVQAHELSTHIAKLASGNLAHLIEVEYLTSLAIRALLPHDEVVELGIQFIPAIKEEALVVTRCFIPHKVYA